MTASFCGFKSSHRFYPLKGRASYRTELIGGSPQVRLTAWVPQGAFGGNWLATANFWYVWWVTPGTQTPWKLPGFKLRSKFRSNEK